MRLNLDRAAIQRTMTGADGLVHPWVADLCQDVVNNAKTRSPVDEGQLRASIDSAISSTATEIRGRVGSGLPQAAYINFGTGIYGPKGAPITPKHGRFLVFEPSRSMGPLRSGGRHGAKGKRGGPVFAKSVRGVPRNPFLLDALRAVAPGPVRETST